ncbi:glycosyltransferase family 32 protein [Carboxylicivirga marina]|uniref:glycosyltransferase family 32 protein n=1 Tax=Carboxylicivirga marina TaxID=2800988 RepID=UPI002594FF01|nr:glycosyltransferase [uncultured Carboxylicivirga sp.]
MIPKIIHYVWFGNPQKPDIVLKCIDSWKTILPDYDIIEWNEDNSPIDHPFVKYCLENKQWAYASDYVRLWALYQYGGIYLDTDMEVKKNFTKVIQNKSFCSAYETPSLISAGMIASAKHSDIAIMILTAYDNILFPEPIPNIITKVFNLNPDWYQRQDVYLGKQLDFYPTKCEIKSHVSYTIHHFEASWVKSFRAFRLNYIHNLFNLKNERYPFHKIIRGAQTESKYLKPTTAFIYLSELEDFKIIYTYEYYLKGPVFNPRLLLNACIDLRFEIFKQLKLKQFLGFIIKNLLFYKGNVR